MRRKNPGKPRVVREDSVRSYRVRETMSEAVLRGNFVSAADFKATCLSLMDQVSDTGAEFVITKHNKPVARLVPVLDEAGSAFIGRAASFMTVTGDIVAPTAPDWEVGEDI